MNLIRKIKLNKLGCYNFNDSEKILVNFIKEHLLNLRLVKLSADEFIDNLHYFNSDNKCIIDYHTRLNICYINSNLVENVLRSDFGYSYDEIKLILIDICNNFYKLNLITYYSMVPLLAKILEEEYYRDNLKCIL